MRKIGILTGGGDCPGLNAVIRGVVARCMREDIAVFGFYAGWRGVLENEGRWLTRADVEGIQTLGGTILGSSRTNVMKFENGPEVVREAMERLDLEALVAVGGDDTLGVANTLRKLGMNMIGVPKTIDNDLSCTDWTFGFDTASNIAMEEIDRLHTTAESHERCFVVECMGRHTGWITLQAGVAANAHLVLIPEFPMSFGEIYDLVRSRYLRGERYTIIAVAEGFELTGEKLEELERDMFGNVLLLHRELARHLADRIEKAIRSDETLDKRREHFEARSVVLGHLQRGGAPSAFDRMLGTRMGVKAGDLVVSGEYGNMVSLRGTEIAVADLDRAVTERKKVGKELYDVATLFY
ncbi:MAG: 6-phosphofructokinase [Clostridium sp.]|nr:6-phosphofructokinase [Clostridium sp.]